MDLDPIEQEYDLACTPAEAFAVFTERTGQWWPGEFSPDAASLRDTVIEPRIGGRVYFVVAGMGDVPWGTVTDWQPGRRLVFASTLAQARDFPSEIDVSFQDGPDGGCHMVLRHGGWS